MSELLWKVALNTIIQTLTHMQVSVYYIQIVDNRHNIQSCLLKYIFFHIGTNDPLPGGETLCGTCAPPCASPGNTSTTSNNTSNTNDGKS